RDGQLLGDDDPHVTGRVAVLVGLGDDVAGLRRAYDGPALDLDLRIGPFAGRRRSREDHVLGHDGRWFHARLHEYIVNELVTLVRILAEVVFLLGLGPILAPDLA